MLAVGRRSSVSDERASSPSSKVPTAAWPTAGQASGTASARVAGAGTVSVAGLAVSVTDGTDAGRVSVDDLNVSLVGVAGAGTDPVEGIDVSLTKEAIPQPPISKRIALNRPANNSRRR